MTAVEDTQQQIQRAYAVQAKYSDALMQLPHVVGVGIGFCRFDDHHRGVAESGERQVALIVMVDRKVDEDRLTPAQRIPSTLDGVPVAVQEMGVFTAY